MKAKNFLTREHLTKFKNPAFLKREEVYIERWDTYVRIREMTGAEQQKISAMQKKKGDFGMEEIVQTVTLCVCDDAGVPLFTAEDVADLIQTSLSAIQELMGHVLRINGMTPAAQGELEKN